MTVLIVALLLLLAAAPAGAVELGISDSDAPTVLEAHWAGLNVDRARVVVPYDVATTTGDAGTERRERFEQYRANAAAGGVRLLVVLAHSQDIRAPGTNDPVAPSADEFAAAFAAFRARYPELTTIAPWNEPNNRDTGSYALGSDPRLAAEYWLRAKAICPLDCLLVAGDFAGIPGDDAYVDAYQAQLAVAGAVPDVWAFHAHSDVNRFQVLGVSDARVTRYYLGKLQGPWAGARIWIDEVGARFRDASGLVWGDASQRDATSLLLGLATLDPRIEAIYYYNYANRCATPSGCAVQDRGLVSPAPLNGQPPAYDAANRRRAAYDVIAARGPLILPVAALPPAVAIEQPAQGAALRTATPAFAGRAAETIDTEPTVTLAVFPGAGGTESSAPAQTPTAPVAGRRWAVTAAPLADGIYTARASQAGNPGSTGISEDVVFTIDTVAPATTIARGPGAVSGARDETIEFAASEPGATFACSRDGRPFAPCASPVKLRRLTLGAHAFAVRATDAAGNVQRPATRVRWRVVSLATALAPRLAGLGATLAGGLPLAAACADRCRVTARLDLPHDGGTLARSEVRRRSAGRFALRLRPRGPAAAALRGASTATLRLTLVLRARRADPVVVRRTIALVRSGGSRSLAGRGLPVTLACSSACSTRGARRRGAGASDLRRALDRGRRPRGPSRAGVAVRVTAAVAGPGTAARTLGLRLTLPR
jgi:hypothetical protein